MRINVHDATVKTAQVEVRVLTINGKQVTLAVFRQLQESPLLDDRFDLRGPVWGRVNYHPDGCSKDPEHLHVVWQDGAELRRCRVDPPGRLRKTFETSDDSLLRALFAEGKRYGLSSQRGRAREYVDFPGVAGRVISVAVSDEVRQFIFDDRCKPIRQDKTGMRHYTCGASVEGDEEHKWHWLKRPVPWTSQTDSETEWHRLVREDKAEQALWERSIEQWNALVGLPQLFIAV